MPGADAWAAAGWPAVRRRPGSDDGPGTVPAAITLPASGNAPRRRIAFAAPPTALRAVLPPPLLADAHAGGRLPRAWHDALGNLLALGDAVGVRPRVFGSALWQAVTALPFLDAGSDLDLLWPLTRPAAQAPALLDRLAALATWPAMPPLDGELRFGGRGDASWRELARAGAREVLLRHAGGIAMVRRADLLGMNRC